MNPCRKLRSRLLAVAAMLTLGAIMQAAAPVRPAAESAGVPLEPRTVYLTFDDGPSRNTEAILSVLREEKVPATFFVTLAEQEDYSDAYAALCENGSRVALHCSVHDYDRLYESARSYREDLRELEAGLRELGIPYECHIFSAHRTPEEARAFALSAREQGFGALIAAAGMAAHLAGAIAANTTLPVIGIPCKGPVLDGMDALLSTVQMPSSTMPLAVASAFHDTLFTIKPLASLRHRMGTLPMAL